MDYMAWKAEVDRKAIVVLMSITISSNKYIV